MAGDRRQAVGPQPQLLQEFFDQCKVPFYMYNTVRFIEQKAAQDRTSPDKKVISDLEALEQQKLEQQRAEKEQSRRIARRLLERAKKPEERGRFEAQFDL